MSRDFDLGDILSITTGTLVSPRRMEGIYDILNYMTDDNLFTHQLPRAIRECRPPLLVQHPDLAAVSAPEVDCRGNLWAQVFEWLDFQKATYGDSLPVWQLGTGGVGAHERLNPLTELVDMVGPERVVAVMVDGPVGA